MSASRYWGVIQPLPDLTCNSSQLTLPAFVCQAKKTQEKEAASKPQKAEAKTNEWCQATPPAGGKRDRRVQRLSRKQHAVPEGNPPGGSSTKVQEQTKWASMKSDCQNPVGIYLNTEHVVFATRTPETWGQWKLYTNFKYKRYKKLSSLYVRELPIKIFFNSYFILFERPQKLCENDYWKPFVVLKRGVEQDYNDTCVFVVCISLDILCLCHWVDR